MDKWVAHMGPVIQDSPDAFTAMSETTARHDWRQKEKLWHVAVDVKETLETYEFFADLPGMKKKDVTVKLEGNHTLIISGRRTLEEQEGKDGTGHWHRTERDMGSFVRKFHLPDKADLSSISAAVEDGVLKIHIRKLVPGHPHEKDEHTTIPIH